MKKLITLLVTLFTLSAVHAQVTIPGGTETVILEDLTPAPTETFNILGSTINPSLGANGPGLTSTLNTGNWTINNSGAILSGANTTDDAIFFDGISSTTINNSSPFSSSIQGADSGIFLNNIAGGTTINNVLLIRGGTVAGSEGTAIKLRDVINPTINNGLPGIIQSENTALPIAIDIAGADLGNITLVNDFQIIGNILVQPTGSNTTTISNNGNNAAIIGTVALDNVNGTFTNTGKVTSTTGPAVSILTSDTNTIEIFNNSGGILEGVENVVLKGGVVNFIGGGVQKFTNAGQVKSTDITQLVVFDSVREDDINPPTQVELVMQTGSSMTSTSGTPSFIGSRGMNDWVILDGSGSQTGNFEQFEFLQKNNAGNWTIGGVGNKMEFDLIDSLAGTLTISGDINSALMENIPAYLFPIVGTLNLNNCSLELSKPKDGSDLSSMTIYTIMRAGVLNVDGGPVAPSTTCDPSVTPVCFGGLPVTPTLANFKVTLELDMDNNVNVILMPMAFADIIAPLGPNENELAIATYLDSLGILPGSQLDALFTPFYNGTPEAILDILPQLAPLTHSDQSLTNINSAALFNNSIFRHNTDLRTHNPPPRKTSVWMQGFGNFNHRGNKGVFAGFDSRTYGFTLGGDYFILGNHLSAGAAFGYANTQLDSLNNLGGLRADNVLFGLYSAYKDLNPEHAGYFFDLAVNGSYNVIRGKRSIPLAGLVAQNKHHGLGVCGELHGGYNFATKDVLFGPFASLGYYYDRLNGYTESGAGIFNLSVGRRIEDQFRAEIGARLVQDIELVTNVIMSPTLKLSWLHKNPLRRSKVSGGFVGFPGLRVSTFDQTLNQLSAGLGMTFVFYTDTFMKMYYEGEFGNKHRTHELGAKYSYRF